MALVKRNTPLSEIELMNERCIDRNGVPLDTMLAAFLLSMETKKDNCSVCKLNYELLKIVVGE